MVHLLWIILVAEFAQRPSAKHQSDACCSLSLRERVRVRGKYCAEHAKCSISQGLVSKHQSLVQCGSRLSAFGIPSPSDIRIWQCSYCVSPRVTRMNTSSRPSSYSSRPTSFRPPCTTVSATQP